MSGEFYRPNHGAACRAYLTRRGDTVQVSRDTDSADLASAPISAIDISAQVGSIPRRITYSDGSVFVTEDNNAINRLLIEAAGRGFVHRLERFHPRLIIVVVVAAVLIAGVLRYGVPVFVNVAVALTPESVPAAIGSTALTALDQALFSPSELDEGKRKVIEDGFGRLRAHAHTSELTLLFRDGGPVGPNALALPNGAIVLTDQLVELAESNAQILAVLAHEIGHVERQHSLKQLYRGLTMAAVITLVGGDVGELTESILLQGSAILALSYSREQEYQADRRSVVLMSAIGLEPDALAEFLRQLTEVCPDCDQRGFLSTHPGNEERIAVIDALTARIQNRD